MTIKQSETQSNWLGVGDACFLLQVKCFFQINPRLMIVWCWTKWYWSVWVEISHRAVDIWNHAEVLFLQ